MKKVYIAILIISISITATASEFTDYADYIDIRNIYLEKVNNGKIKPSFDCTTNDIDAYKKVICNSFYLPIFDNFLTTYYNYLTKNIDNDCRANIERQYAFIVDDIRKCATNNSSEEVVAECMKKVFLDGVHLINLILRYYEDGKYFNLYEDVFRGVKLEPEPFDFLPALSTAGTINFKGSLKTIDKEKISPTFDCTKSKTTEEKAVCSSHYLLPVLDRFFTQYYSYAMNKVNEIDKAKVKNIATDMMKSRADCRNRSSDNLLICVRYVYTDASYTLSEFLLNYDKGRYAKIYSSIFNTKTLPDKSFWRKCLFLGRTPSINYDGSIDTDRLK